MTRPHSLTFLPAHLVALLAALLALAATPAAARTLEVGETRAFKTPSEAIRAAQDGDRVVIDPGEYFDCAVVAANNLTIEGAKPDGSAILTDKACQGKALLVTTGRDITIRNLTLTRARVPDMNGAGIRAEGTNLTVERVKFINNQNGILAAGNPASTIIVRDSEFLRNGYCSPCAHGIYVNALKLLQVERSKFADTRQAHHIKSRAARTEVIGCDLRDGDTGTASYHIDISNGGSVVVRDTTMQKGPEIGEPHRGHHDRRRGGDPAHPGNHHREQHHDQHRRLPDLPGGEPDRHRGDAERQQVGRPGQAAQG